ncbi:MAG: tRNA (adenosine(37)-N6)-threonylcarbamoyltransferase complex dimerization subunit type 1 TsaB [Alkalispirochaeta sp.]
MSRILGIDTSGPILGLCLLEGSELADAIDDHSGMRHTENLLPAIETLLRRNDRAGRIDAIAVAAGPGSFTGLRIGMATAKGLALAWDQPLISVGTLEALAETERGFREIAAAPSTAAPSPSIPDAIIPVLDARKRRFYVAVFVETASAVKRITEDMDVSLDRVEELIGRYDNPCVPGADGPMMEERFGIRPAAASGRSAAYGVALVGARRLEAGTYDDPYRGPFYLRETDIGLPKQAPRFTPE